MLIFVASNCDYLAFPFIFISVCIFLFYHVLIVSSLEVGWLMLLVQFFPQVYHKNFLSF